jgi:hypothetical protein
MIGSRQIKPRTALVASGGADPKAAFFQGYRKASVFPIALPPIFFFDTDTLEYAVGVTTDTEVFTANLYLNGVLIFAVTQDDTIEVAPLISGDVVNGDVLTCDITSGDATNANIFVY